MNALAGRPADARRRRLQVGPKGVEFAKYSIDYHYIRNYLAVTRRWPARRAERHIPEFARRIVEEYDTDGKVAERAAMKLPGQ